jgi:hypothetical protein
MDKRLNHGRTPKIEEQEGRRAKELVTKLSRRNETKI